MRIALVTPPPDPESVVDRVVGHLLPHLRRQAAIEVFVPAERADVPWPDERPRPLEELRPREFEQILYPLGNEPGRAFALPLVRGLGGTVVLFDWWLCDLARAAWPELAAGGLRGFLRALREGGPAEAAAWRGAGAAGPDRSSPDQSNPDRPALNRSVVRFADAFLVPTEELKERILASRNAPTPIGVLPWGPPAGGGDDEHWRRIAETAVALMERFPHARASRRSLIVMAVRERWRSRAERAPES